jgi:hypothetical protein
MMIRRLTSRLKRYDRSRRALFEELATLSPEKLTAIDGPGKWSILQVVQHMIRAESSVLQNRPDPTRLLPKNLSMRAHLGYLAVLFVLLFDIPVPVPDSGMAPNDNDLSLKKLKNETRKLNIRLLARSFHEHERTLIGFRTIRSEESNQALYQLGHE